MSTWSDNPEFYDDFLWDYASKGNLGPEIQKLCDEGEILAYELWKKVSDDQLLKVFGLADEAYWERFYEEADARRKAQKEDALCKG